MGRVKVIIKDKKFIPTVGNGPILSPISVTQNQLILFRKLGLNVQIVGETNLSIPTVKTEEDEKVELIEKEDEETLDIVEEDEISDKEKKDETPSDTESDEEELDIENMSKDELKALLDEKGIKYKYNSTLSDLKKLAQNL